MLGDFIAGDYSKFPILSGTLEESWKRYSRTLPPELFQFTRRCVMNTLIERGSAVATDQSREPLKLRVVIDTNTLVFESFSVGRGRKSSTARLFESPFVEVYAPIHIKEESERIIREKRPKDVDEKKAIAHARMLIGKLHIVENLTSEALRRAKEKLMENAPEDVPFLAVAFDTDSPFIVSTDHVAFDDLNSIERWYLKDFATTVVSVESGSLSLVILGEGGELAFHTLEAVVLGLARAVFQILEVIASAAVGLVTGAIEVLSQVPDWAWAIIIGILAAAVTYVGIRAAVDEEFRGKIVDGLSRLYDGAARVFRAIVAWIRAAIQVVQSSWYGSGESSNRSQPSQSSPQQYWCSAAPSSLQSATVYSRGVDRVLHHESHLEPFRDLAVPVYLWKSKPRSVPNDMYRLSAPFRASPRGLPGHAPRLGTPMKFLGFFRPFPQIIESGRSESTGSHGLKARLVCERSTRCNIPPQRAAHPIL